MVSEILVITVTRLRVRLVVHRYDSYDIVLQSIVFFFLFLFVLCLVADDLVSWLDPHSLMSTNNLYKWVWNTNKKNSGGTDFFISAVGTNCGQPSQRCDVEITKT